MEEHSGPFIVLPLLAAWGADTCALFSGMLFGKHRLAPVVSPKKRLRARSRRRDRRHAVLVMLAALLMNVLLDLDMPVWAAAVL